MIDNTVKIELNSDFERIRDFHLSGGSGFETARRLTLALDCGVRRCADMCHDEGSSPIAIVAIGGYGRVELCPKSDIDIMILAGDKTRESEQIVTEIIHKLWNLDIDIGHSFRTVEECVEIYETDIESWASLLESRFVWGNRELFKIYIEKIKERTDKGSTDFIRSIIDGNKFRHEKYGNSIKLLEPNIKKSAGGLRDLHTLLWMFRATDIDFWKFPDDLSACRYMLKLIGEKGMVDEEQIASVISALEFMLRTRIELHFISNYITDILDFNIQEKVADGLGYRDNNSSSGVELFMRDYYLHARKIFRLNKVITLKFEEMVNPRKSVYVKKLDETFSIQDGKWLILSEEREKLSSDEIFRVFYYKCRTGAHIDENIYKLILKNLDQIKLAGKFRNINEIFKLILKSDDNVGETLQSMNELGVLGRYIPEFGKLIAFFQHSYYHFYTADAHTLIAIENVEKLRREGTLLGDIFRKLKRKDVLYLGILFHDIAKPLGVGEHESVGAEIARDFLKRINFDRIEDVCFLVENHLLMEQIAFRRNFHAPETLFEFASKFKNVEQLDMLYLLTYADLSAVNPDVWTDWKAQLLEELYLMAYPVVDRKMGIDEIYEFHSERAARRISEIISALSEKVSKETIENHFESLIENDAYFSVFSRSEMEEHIRRIVDSGEDKVDVIFTRRDGYTEITVITFDAPFVLAKICGVLSANDANIFDAQIFTRRDGIVIDRFRVFDYVYGGELSVSQCRKIEQDLRDVFNNKLDLSSIFEKHRRRWQRRIRRVNSNVKIAVEFEESRDYTIIDVFAPDSLGFLYRVAEKMSKLGLNIYFAKIATRVDGIVDTFYVLDSDGNKIISDEFKNVIRGEILNVIYELNNYKLI